MSLDYINATKMVEKFTQLQIDNPELNYIMTAYIIDKKEWDVQIIGCYDLLFPWMHEDFPTRDDIYTYISELFRTHHGMNYHYKTPNFTMVMPIFMRDPATITGITNMYTINPLVRRGSPINSIGYGV